MSTQHHSSAGKGLSLLGLELTVGLVFPQSPVVKGIYLSGPYFPRCVVTEISIICGTVLNKNCATMSVFLVTVVVAKLLGVPTPLPEIALLIPPVIILGLESPGIPGGAGYFMSPVIVALLHVPNPALWGLRCLSPSIAASFLCSAPSEILLMMGLWVRSLKIAFSMSRHAQLSCTGRIKTRSSKEEDEESHGFRTAISRHMGIDCSTSTPWTSGVALVVEEYFSRRSAHRSRPAGGCPLPFWESAATQLSGQSTVE